MLSSIVICSIFFTNQRERLENNKAFRTFTISDISKIDLESGVIKQLLELKDLSSITVYLDELELKANYIYSPQDQLIILGEYFIKTDFESGAKQIIINNPTESTRIGDYVEIYGYKYKIVGINQSNGYYYNEVPPSALPNFNGSYRLSICLKEIPTNTQKEEIQAYMHEVFPNSIIEEPTQINIIIFASNMTEYAICVGIIALSVLNTAYLYEYILEIKKKQLIIMRITGCSKKRCLLISIVEILIISSFIFGMCCILNEAFIYSLISAFYGHNTHYLNVKTYFSLYLLFMAIIYIIYGKIARKIMDNESLEEYLRV